MYKKYEVIEPPTVQSLLELVNKQDSAALSQLALRLVVRLEINELSARRQAPIDEEVTLNVESLSFGTSPFLNGHLDNDPTVYARLEPDNDRQIVDHDRERPLKLSVYEAEPLLKLED